MSVALEAVLAARVHESGRAIRRTTLRHTYLARDPLGVVVWRLGGERFRAAAVAWGPLDGEFRLAVAGEPRSRPLYFRALLPFAQDLCAAVRSANEVRVEPEHERWAGQIPGEIPQIVVANRATVSALGLLGRYLGFLSNLDGNEPPPALIEAGRHLRFYARQARVPGQSLVVPLDRLLGEHWATLLSPFEQANVAALDAQIDPPAGMHAFDASAFAEDTIAIGPEPVDDLDRRAADLVEAFNRARGRSTAPEVVGPLLPPIEAHYRQLVNPVWQLLRTCVERERVLPAASSVDRRLESDRRAFGRHCDWVLPGLHQRTRETPRQAIMALRRLEEEQSRYEAERAVEDPALMIPHLLSGEAIQGTVASLDLERREQGPKNLVQRPQLTMRTGNPVVLPDGKRLWWTETAGGDHWEVRSVRSTGAGSLVELVLSAPPGKRQFPAVGDRIVLSTLSTKRPGFPTCPAEAAPWTHTPEDAAPREGPIDAGDTEEAPPPVDPSQVADPESYA